MGESLGNIFGTKLPPDNCFPWTGRSNTKIYKDIQRNTKTDTADTHTTQGIFHLSLRVSTLNMFGGFSAAFKSNHAPTCVLYCQKGLISSLYLLFKVPSKKHSEICPALVISQS